MSSSKPELTRAGTMQVTSKEGSAFLDRNLTEWKKPYLMPGGEKNESDDSGEGSESDSPAEEPAPVKGKPKLAKHTTMKGTAKAAADFLDSKGKPDEDALTRGQQRKLEEISAEKPPSKKGKMARAGTMAATSKEAKTLLGGEKLGDTRLESQKKKNKPAMKRASTVKKTLLDAEAYGDTVGSGSRQLRKRPAPPPKAAPKAKKAAMKRAGTMQKTATEGKEYLGRGKKGNKKAAKKGKKAKK